MPWYQKRFCHCLKSCHISLHSAGFLPLSAKMSYRIDNTYHALRRMELMSISYVINYPCLLCYTERWFEVKDESCQMHAGRKISKEAYKKGKFKSLRRWVFIHVQKSASKQIDSLLNPFFSVIRKNLNFAKKNVFDL